MRCDGRGGSAVAVRAPDIAGGCREVRSMIRSAKAPVVVIAVIAGLALAGASVALSSAWLGSGLGAAGALDLETRLGASLPGPSVMLGLVALIALSLVGIGVVIGVEARAWTPPSPAPAAQPAPITIKLEAAGLKLDCEAAAILKLIRSYLEANETYATSLAHAGRSLPALADADQVRGIVQELIAENAKMQLDANDLRTSLEQSRSQIDALRCDLAEAQELGLRDPLTAVGNRRCLDTNLAKEIDAAQAQATPMCLVLGDIDHFKKINDAFGHVVGDEVLKVFARLLSTNVKSCDTVARYGGEEFAIILPRTELEGAKRLTERIRGELEEKRLVVNACGRQVGEITASFGIAQFADGDDPTKLIQRADDKLYEAKHAGRNRVAHDGKIAA